MAPLVCQAVVEGLMTPRSYQQLKCYEAAVTFARTEGIIPALESSHALAYAGKLAATLGKDKIIVVNLSGRGDKDMHTIADLDGIKI